MAEVEEAGPQPDLVWDDQARGLCMRVYIHGSQSFLFVYRINDRQRFIKIGKTPVWSLGAARKRANELRAIVDEGNDPASYRREREKVRPVENVIQYIAENQQKQRAPRRFPPPWSVEESDACFCRAQSQRTSACVCLF